MRVKFKFGCLGLMFLTVIACSDSNSSRIDELLDSMTLEEKVGQMNQYSGFYDATGPSPEEGDAKNKYENVKKGLVGSMLNVRGVEAVRAMQKIAVEESRLGIPMIFGFDVIHGYKTTFPIPLAEAASWDMDAIENAARISAIEAAAAGINWTFAPMVDVSRDARWGRVMEGSGEDPFLGSAIAVARVKGFQGDDLSDEATIAACAKHFAAYGFAESGKDYNTADVGTSTLYNIILPPFKAAVDAGVKTFMNSFNELNGIPATGSQELQRGLLKGEWGFDGFVVSDWGSIGEMRDHGFAANGEDAARIAVNAGSDMDMESHLYVKHLVELVKSGVVRESHIDDAVRRILEVKEELGLFDDPYKYCDAEREELLIGHEDHVEAALDMARKSMVLLKNEGNLLPLAKEGQKIALIGPLAHENNSPLGNWRLAADDSTAVTVLEGLKTYEGNQLEYAEGVRLVNNQIHFPNEVEINTTDKGGMDQAVKAAASADVVLMVLGEYGYQTGEGRSQSDIGLAGLQQELLEKVHAVNPNIVLVLMNGRPLALEWADKNIPAILETWHLGEQSGNAIAEVLYGDYNPSGKLPVSFPRNVGQVPIYYNYKNTGRPGPKGEVFWSHYTDSTNDPLYGFGHGLSYSDFVYEDLKITTDDVENKVTVNVTVHNDSNIDGEEVVQVYIRDRVASVTRPVKELKAFKKVLIKAGTRMDLEFVLEEKELGFFDNNGVFIFENGEFDIMVGGNSQFGIKSSFELN